MLSCLCTSAQASDPELASWALAQALARPGNVAAEAVLGAQSTWLRRDSELTVSGASTLSAGKHKSPHLLSKSEA